MLGGIAMELPNKIYLSKTPDDKNNGCGLYYVDSFGSTIEYVNKEAFIEKALSWLEYHVSEEERESFKEYMEK